MSSELKAVLDIGSNTIRLLIGRVDAQQKVERIFYKHWIARLGEGLQQTGLLGEAGIARAISNFITITEHCHEYGIAAADIMAVATAAVREASNGLTFVEQVADETGVRIQVISGNQEAALALAGARRGLPDAVADDMLLFDIGGGSTEFNRVQDGEMVDAYSLKLGVVRLIESVPVQSIPSDDDYRALKAKAATFLDELYTLWGVNQRCPKHLVGTAGTVTTIAAIAQGMTDYDPERINGYALSFEHFSEVRNKLLALPPEQRLTIPGLEKGREDVIVAGLAILDVLFERFGFEQLFSVDSGLLEGLFFQG